MNEPIQVAIGVASESGEGPMQFLLHDIGASIHEGYTVQDLQVAVAVLRDLADALEARLAQLTN